MEIDPQAVRDYDKRAPSADETRTATFSLGCFWGPEARFGALDGVVRTRVGYAGGTMSNPTYRDLGDHTEAFQVDHDPDRLSYADLLGTVFEEHDPRHQARTPQYQNIVFTDTTDQQAALESFLETAGLDAGTVETRLERFSGFYLAEPYHQKYRLESNRSMSAVFQEAGYDTDAVRESPAAAKLNGLAAGHEIETEGFGLAQSDRA